MGGKRGEGDEKCEGDADAPNYLEVRRRMRLAELNVQQSHSLRFQLDDIRLDEQHGVVLAATAGNEHLSAAVAGDGLEQSKEFLTSGGDGKNRRRHGFPQHVQDMRT